MSINYHSQPVRRRVVTFVDEVVVQTPISSARSRSASPSPYSRPPTAYPSISSSSQTLSPQQQHQQRHQQGQQKSIKRQFIFKDPDEPSVTSSRIADEEIKELNNELGKAGVVIEVSQLGEIKESKGGNKKELDYFKMSFNDLDVDFSDRVSYLNLAKEPEVRLSARLKKPEDRRRMYDSAERLSARGNGVGGGAGAGRDRDMVENDDSGDSVIVPSSGGRHSYHHQPPDPNIRLIWQDAIDLGEIRNIQDQTDFRSLRIQLGIDRIPSETLSRYHLKGHMDSYEQPAICYPRYFGPSGRTRTPGGLKLIRRIGDKLEKENYPESEDYGKPRFSGIFGYHMVTPSDRRVIITTNERDALAVYAATGGLLCLALPNAERLDHSVIPFLEDFETIHFWFPAIHEKYARDYASYLSGARCYIITKKERPIELIREERIKEIKRAIHEEAVRVRNPGFRCINDVREDVKNEIIHSKTKTAGFAQWKRFDVLNHYLKGFRPSELTVLTGGTGTGKTTFVCEYSLDLYAQGVRTLFCSFEMPEEKILKWMLVQYAAPTHLRSLSRTRTYHNGVKLPLHRVENHPSVEMWLDRFERTKGDLIVMKTDEFRDKTVTEIANAIREQVIAGGIQHVVIDNLQFLVNLATLHNDKTSAIERYHQQDRFVGLLRSLATDYRIHITLVVHPRKVEGEEIDIHHIGGSSRVIQEADNVLAIQRHRDEVDKRKFRKFLYILKNRYGMRRVESDQIEMVFQPSTYTHTLIDYAQSKCTDFEVKNT